MGSISATLLGSEFNKQVSFANVRKLRPMHKSVSVQDILKYIVLMKDL